MANDILTTVTINPNGGPVGVEVHFGFANVGVYRIFSWDAANTPTLVGEGHNVLDGKPDREPVVHTLATAPVDLNKTQLSFEAQVQSPASGTGQMYSLLVLVRQDGQVVPKGSIEQTGPLPTGGGKTLFGFVRFA